MEQPAASMPFQAAAHDSLRAGLPSLREDALAPHPVQLIQARTAPPGGEASAPGMLRDLYGAAFPAKLDIERQILSKFGRLPGLPSSRLGLEALTGELDSFAFESYLDQPEHSTEAPVDLHSQMEAKLGLAPATKPLARGLL